MSRGIIFMFLVTLFSSQFYLAGALGQSDYKSSAALSFQVNYVYRSGGKGELKPISNRDVLESGDHYKIIFTPDKTSYVYIFQVDSSGHIFQLFPMTNFKGVKVSNLNPVHQGRTYILPGPDTAFMLDRQAGVERIYFLAANERHTELEGLYDSFKKTSRQKDLSNMQDARDKLNRYFKKRGVFVTSLEETVEVPWQESGDVFSVMGQKIENMCQDCVNVVEFIHQ